MVLPPRGCTASRSSAGDWRQIIDAYDTQETVFYCDPPYHPSTRHRGGYAHELTAQDHEDLVQRLLSIRGTALLSGYAHPVFEPLEAAGWARVDWPVSASSVRRHGHAERVESLWVHPRAARVRQRSIFECAAPGFTRLGGVLWPVAVGVVLMIGLALAH